MPYKKRHSVTVTHARSNDISVIFRNDKAGIVISWDYDEWVEKGKPLTLTLDIEG